MIVLGLKTYLLLFVMDFTLGIYSFFSSFVLFNILLFAYTKYKDPYIDAANIPIDSLNMDNLPLFSIVVPVKNEEENIRNCVQSCINQSYPKKEIIIVNDGSTDRTAEVLDEMRREEKAKNHDSQQLRILHLSRSVGKKKAIEFASQISKGEIYAFMDSDCDMAYDAVEKAERSLFQINNSVHLPHMVESGARTLVTYWKNFKMCILTAHAGRLRRKKVHFRLLPVAQDL